MPLNLIILDIIIYLMIQLVPLGLHIFVSTGPFPLTDIPEILFDPPRFAILSTVWLFVIAALSVWQESIGKPGERGIIFPVGVRIFAWLFAPLIATAIWLLIFCSLAWSLLELNSFATVLQSIATPWLAVSGVVNLLWIVFTLKFGSQSRDTLVDIPQFMFMVSLLITLPIFMLTIYYIQFIDLPQNPNISVERILDEGFYAHILGIVFIFLQISNRSAFRRPTTPDAQ